MAIAPTLNIPQAKFLAMQYKFKAYVAGFGSGKTWVGCGGICKGMWEHPKINQGYFAPTYPQIRDIFYPTVEEVARDWGLNVKINEGNKEVHFYAGRQYRGTTICRSMEKPQTIVGFKIGNALIDELDVMPAKKAQLAWRKIIARMRYTWPVFVTGSTSPRRRKGLNSFISSSQKQYAISLRSQRCTAWFRPRRSTMKRICRRTISRR